MQDQIREKDAVELAANTSLLRDARTVAFAEVRTLLKQQLNSYGANSVRWAVMNKTLDSLDLLEKSPPSLAQTVLAAVKSTPLPSKHRLHGTSCPACGRTMTTSLRGDVVCQNGHRQS